MPPPTFGLTALQQLGLAILIIVAVLGLLLAAAGIALWAFIERYPKVAARAREEHRRNAAGVLRPVADAESPAPPAPPDSRRSWGSPDPADEGVQLGFAACAYAHWRTGGLLWEPEPHELAALDLETARAEHDAQWRRLGFDDERVREQALNELPLSVVLSRSHHCLYCGAALIRQRTDDISHEDASLTTLDVWFYETGHCLRCGWWQLSYIDDYMSFTGASSAVRHAYGVMRQFDPLALDTPLTLARDFLARNPHRLARFDPFRFEDLMADCLRDYFGDANIVKLGGRRDGGIDIKAVHANGETTLIQTKRRSDFARRESVTVIRELHGVMLREGVPSGMVISTAGGYSADARAEVTRIGRRLRHYSMELLCFSDVVDLLGRRVTPSAPWRDFGLTADAPHPRWPATDDVIERALLPASVIASL